MSKENPNLIEEDEISLLDLFVVLLRYRKLILGAVLFSIIAAVGGYFLYPSYKYNKMMESRLVEARMTVSPGPAVKNIAEKMDVQAAFFQPQLLLGALKTAGYETYGYSADVQFSLTSEADRSGTLFMIRQLLIENSSLDGDKRPESKRLFSVEKVLESENIVIAFRNGSPKRASAFLTALYREAEDLLEGNLKTYAESIVTAYERLLAIKEPGAAVKEAVNNGWERYDTAKRLLLGKAETLAFASRPQVLEPVISREQYQGDSIKIGIVLVFAVLFLSIFLAFILNAFAQVRQNAESMAKIRDALGKK